jgi:hypothetical protein
MSEIEKGTYSPEELEVLNNVPGDSQPPTGTEPVSEDVKPPVAETPAPQPVKEEKTVPYDRFKKVNDELVKMKKDNTPTAEPTKESEVKSSSPVDLVRLGKKLEKFNDEELDFIIAHAGTDDKEKILEASKDEYVQLAIEAKRQKVADENKVPSTTSGGFATESGKAIADMDAAEFQKLEEKANAEAQRGRGI